MNDVDVFDICKQQMRSICNGQEKDSEEVNKTIKPLTFRQSVETRGLPDCIKRKIHSRYKQEKYDNNRVEVRKICLEIREGKR